VPTLDIFIQRRNSTKPTK